MSSLIAEDLAEASVGQGPRLCKDLAWNIMCQSFVSLFLFQMHTSQIHINRKTFNCNQWENQQENYDKRKRQKWNKMETEEIFKD